MQRDDAVPNPPRGDDAATGRLLADLLYDYHRRKALGESVTVEEYRDPAGAHYSTFRLAVEAATAPDGDAAAMSSDALPRRFGAYLLLRELGRGAMGIVFEAVHCSLGRKAALKILSPSFASDRRAVERFQREARACAQLRHDNIVRIHEAGSVGEQHFFAMDLLPGKDLYRLALDDELPPVDELAGAIADVADALHALHDLGIVHRDVKPSNIVMETSGRMVLTDFGIARSTSGEPLTEAHERMGTPLYMSPECMMGSPGAVNARSDVYSLGACLYEIVERRPIYRATNIADLVHQKMHQRPEQPALAPDALADIIMKAVERENDDRYTDAAALRDDLRAFSRGGQVEGRPVSDSQRALRAVRSRVRLMVAGLVIAAAAIVGWWLLPPSPARLDVVCVPDAQIHVGEILSGRTPYSGEIPAGDHVLVLRRRGWPERRVPVNVQPGGHRSIETMLVPEDPNDQEAIRTIAAALDLTQASWASIERFRGDEDPYGFAPLFPRGAVRASDLTNFRVRIGDLFEGAGALEFRHGDRVLFRRTVDDAWPSRVDTTEPLGAEPFAGLEPGSNIEWGFFPTEGEPVTTTMQIVDTDVSARLAHIESRLKDQSPILVGQIVARMLLEEGLPYAAYTKAAALVEDEPNAVSAYEVMRESLRRLDLDESTLWNELVDATRDL